MFGRTKVNGPHVTAADWQFDGHVTWRQIFEYVKVETKRRRANVKRVAQFDGKSDETRNGDPRHFEDTLTVNWIGLNIKIITDLNEILLIWKCSFN